MGEKSGNGSCIGLGGNVDDTVNDNGLIIFLKFQELSIFFAQTLESLLLVLAFPIFTLPYLFLPNLRSLGIFRKARYAAIHCHKLFSNEQTIMRFAFPQQFIVRPNYCLHDPWECSNYSNFFRNSMDS